MSSSSSDQQKEEKKPKLEKEEEEDVEESGEDDEQQKQTSASGAKQKKQKMKRTVGQVAEQLGQLAGGSTYSNPELLSIIMQAQHRVFGALKLEEITEERAKTRVHANPLSKQFLDPTQPPADWKEWFEDPTKPIGIDVGCAAGRFSLLMASGLAGDKVPEEFRNINHLGLEIRRPLVDRANGWKEGLGVKGSVRFVVSSANVSLESLLRSYPGKIKFICVQFPDPHFKRKHHKRRVVNEAFIRVVSSLLPEDGYFFVQSDVEEAAAQMRDRIDMFPNEFRRVGEYSSRDLLLEKARVVSGDGEEYWTRDGKRALPGGPDYGDWKIGANPMGVPTEREVQNEALGLPIYRALFQRNAKQ